MTEDEAWLKIRTDPDFVNLKRYDYSLTGVLERFPNGASTKTIASALMISPEEVDEIYSGIVQKLRQGLLVDPEDTP